MGAAARRQGDRGMTAIVRLKVTLEDVEPEVMRRLDVPLKIHLDDSTSSCRRRWAGRAAISTSSRRVTPGWGVPDADFGGGPMPAAKTTLDDVIKDTGARTIHYLYDFGGGWDHVIKIERIGERPAGPLPAARHRPGPLPPEDVGGPPGYAEFLAAIADRARRPRPYAHLVPRRLRPRDS